MVKEGKKDNYHKSQYNDFFGKRNGHHWKEHKKEFWVLEIFYFLKKKRHKRNKLIWPKSKTDVNSNNYPDLSD